MEDLILTGCEEPLNISTGQGSDAVFPLHALAPMRICGFHFRKTPGLDPGCQDNWCVQLSAHRSAHRRQQGQLPDGEARDRHDVRRH